MTPLRQSSLLFSGKLARIKMNIQSRYFGPIAAVVLTLCLCAAVLA
jgi:hypothetical protein